MAQITPGEARQIIKALRNGATPSQFADRVYVGQQSWFDAAVKMMAENAEDRHFEVRFVRAAYGGGKTLFMRRMEATARAQGWATSFILLRHGKVELDQPSTLAAELSEQLDLGEQGRGMRALLVAALERKGRECGIAPGRTSSLADHLALENKMRELCAQKALSGDMSVVLRQACKALVKRDMDRLGEIAHWLTGAAVPLLVPSAPGGFTRPTTVKPLGTGAAESLIRLVAELSLMAGKRGLFIALDEVELIGGLVDRRRANAFQTLRALVDQNDVNTIPPATSIFLAATPQMFEDRTMFPSYKALQDRIESLPSISGRREVNYRSNVVDLDATPLGTEELRDLGRRIIGFWATSGEVARVDAEARVDEIVEAVVSRSDYTIARPRLFCRLVVDMLSGSIGPDLGAAAAMSAVEIGRARAREVAGQ